MTSTQVEGKVKSPETLVEFRRFEGPVYAENVSGRRISVNDPDREVSFWLYPYGSTLGDPIMVLPPGALDIPGFRRLILKKEVLLSVDVDLMESKIEEIANGQFERAKMKKQESEMLLTESNTHKDLVQVECLISGEKVFQKVSDYNIGIPPLASRYKDRAHEFLGTKVMDENNNWKYVFTKVTK